jgi:predicted ester cyclase
VNEEVTANKEIVRRFFAALTRNDHQALVECVTADFAVSAPQLRQPMQLADVLADLRLMHQVFEGLQYTLITLIAEGRKVMARYQVSGQQVGCYHGVSVLGPFCVEAVSVFEIVNHKIACEWEMTHRSGQPPPTVDG